MAGGLTFGAGAILGGIVGALTMAGAAWGFNTTTDRNRTTMQFADEFMQSLLVTSVLRYLAVAHFGRGRGNFVESEAPPFWQAEVERALAAHGAGPQLWQALRAEKDGGAARERLGAVVLSATSDTLNALYPGSLPTALPHAAAGQN
jgi:hypothetical protein